MLIGRTKELESILAELRKTATAAGVKRIIALSGIFGVGKSTLLREVLTELQQYSQVDAVLYSNEDTRMEYLPEFVYDLMNSFRACRPDVPRYKSDETDSRWMRYRELLQETGTDPEMPQALITGQRSPDTTAQKAAAEGKNSDAVTQLLKTRSADERRLLTDTAGVMCEALIVDLMNTFFPLNPHQNKVVAPDAGVGPKKIVIVIDTYEKMTAALNAWLLESLLLYCYIKRFGDFRSYNSPYLSAELYVRQFFDIRFVVAGREPLRATDPERRWDRWHQTMLEIELKEFSPDDVREFISEESIVAPVNVDEVINATAGLPYLLSLWAQSSRNKDQLSESSTIASHAQERIFWYKSPEQVEWIRCAAFCDWFDSSVLRCFSCCAGSYTEAYDYLRHASEITRQSRLQTTKLALLPIVQQSIRAATERDNPDIAREYQNIVATCYVATEFLKAFDIQEREALLQLCYFRRFDAEFALREFCPEHISVIQKLMASSPQLFTKNKYTVSLQSRYTANLLQYNSFYERTLYSEKQHAVAELWKRRHSSLESELEQEQQKLELLEQEAIRLDAECDRNEADMHEAQTKVLDCESQITPLRRQTPLSTANRDAAAARLAFVTCIVIGALAWYTPDVVVNFKATPELSDSIQKILFAFAVGFGLLFTFFVSRSLALRSRRRQHEKNRVLLRELDESLSLWKESLNAASALLARNEAELRLVQERIEKMKQAIIQTSEVMNESYI